MIKIRKFLLVILATIAALCLCLGIAACGGQQNEQNGQTKYDVSIRVACSDGEVYEFPVGTDEKHITIPYDGVERTYWVKEYNLPDHPRYSDDWFSPSGEGANVFGRTMTYCPPGGVNQSYSGSVKEVGEYCISIYADSTSDLWNFRSIYLFITVI